MQTLFKAASKSLGGRMLGHALALMHPWAKELTSAPYLDRWQTISRNYRLVADYFMSGADDPQRMEVVDSLVREAYQLLDEMYLRKRLDESTSYEFREMLRPSCGSDNAADAFRYFWLGEPDDAHLARFRQLIAEPEMADEALMAVSALTLNLLRSFSSEALMALISAAAERFEQAIRERAWVGLILVMLSYDERLRFYPELTDAVQDLLDSDDGRVFASTASTCLIRTMGVEWATGAQEQLVKRLGPFLVELFGPDGKKRVSPADMDDFSSRMGDEFSDALHAQDEEMNRIQEEHLDTHFAMFRDMYSVSFFSEPYRWWLPYSDYYLSEELRSRTFWLDVFPKDSLCDSDRYAFIATMTHVQGFDNDPGHRPAPRPDDEYTEYLLCNDYVRQAFRFFRLNPWGIPDPFEKLASVADSSFFRLLYPSALEKNILATHLLRCRAYEPALSVFRSVLDALPTAEVFRNTAFCLQQTGNCLAAASHYARALALEPSEWMLRQQEYCYAHEGHYDEALAVCDRLLELSPDNESYLFEKAKCLEHLELFAEALELYYRLDLLRPGTPSVCRSIAWCSFLCDDSEAAFRYYGRLTDAGADTLVDWLNQGHLCFVAGRRLDAFSFYLKCLRQSDSLRDFLAIFRPDRHFLIEKGIPKNEIYLMEDQLILAHSLS